MQKCMAHLVVAIAVAHGMSVLALDDRPSLGGNVGKGDALVNAGIHGANDVCGICAGPSTLQPIMQP